jgi:DNA polymerase III sliding clamp (beta) subunit (PCNA family)
MKVTITRGELKLMTAGLSKVIPLRPNIAVLGCVRFAVESGTLTAQGTDLDQSARFWFENAKVEGAGEIIIGFTTIRDLAKGDATDTITLENEGLDVTVTDNVGGHVVTRSVDGIDVAEWPPQGEPIPTAEAKGFLEGYRRLAPFASTEESRRTICSVHVDIKGEGEGTATLVATDGRRLTCCNSMTLPIDSITLPVSKFLLWAGLSSEARIGVLKSKTSAWFGLTAGQWSYRVKAADGIYPNWRQVIPRLEDEECHRIAFTDSEVDAMKKIVPTFPGHDEIALQGSEDGRLSLYGIEKGNAKALTVPLVAGSTYAGPGCLVYVNRHYLLDALNAGFRKFMFSGTASPLLSQDGKGATTVLMPLRMGHEEKKAEAPAQAESAQASSETPATATRQLPEPKKEETTMKKQEQEKQTVSQQQPQEPVAVTALERAQASYEKVKACIREVQASLADMASDLREAVRDDRQRKQDTEGIRAMLVKIQTMKIV